MTIKIEDLTVSNELDTSEKSAVRGGFFPASVPSQDIPYYPSWLIWGYPGLN